MAAVWPIRLNPSLVIRKEFATIVTRFGDGYEFRQNRNQAFTHPDGQGGVTSHRGRWGFDIHMEALDHANGVATKEANQFWSFVLARRGNWESFYFYNPIEAPTIDLTGTQGTGRYLVRFMDSLAGLENYMLRVHRGNLRLIEVHA